jgi:WHEP-TRS domain
MASVSDVTTDLTTAVSNSLSITDNNLPDLIKKQGDLVRKLKADKAPKEEVCRQSYRTRFFTPMKFFV